MRLLKLRVKNIASLKGEHTISFEEITGYSSLFAITGETGSGKSTILNSIGLALYGDIFKKTLNQIDVVTLGESEGQIELIFGVRGRKYLASWYVRTRKQNGEAYANTPTPTRQLFSLDGNDFSSERKATTEKVEDLLHLDYDQFSKCVVLNQGEFAKFLMSSFAERRAILEKLYPGELLGNLVKVLKGELDSLLAQKEHLEIELKTIQDDGITLARIEQELTIARRELALHENWFELFEKITSEFTTLSHYHQKNLENLKRIESTKKDLIAGTSAYNVLLKGTEDAQTKKDLAQKTFDQRAPQLQELLKIEENLQSERKQLATLLMDEKRIQLEINSASEKLQNLSAEEKRVLPEREKLIQKMKHPYEAVSAQREKLNQLFDLSDNTEKLRQTQDFNRERLQSLENRGKEASTRFQEIEDKLKKIPEGIGEKLQSLQKKREDSQRARTRSIDLTQEISRIENLISEAKSHSQNLKLKHKEDKEGLLSVLSTLKVQELLSAVSVCLFHPQTEEKETCPVCESPFPKSKLQDLRLLSEGLDIEKLKKKEEDLRSSVVKLETEMAFQEKNLTEQLTKLSSLKGEWEKLSKFCGPLEELEKEIGELQKLSWDREQLIPLLASTEQELKKVRLEYKDAKAKLNEQETVLASRDKDIQDLIESLREALPDLKKEDFPALRLDARLSIELSEIDSRLSRMRNDSRHWNERKDGLARQISELLRIKAEKEAHATALNKKLKDELKGESAVQELKKLTEALKEAQENLDKIDRERQKQDVELKSLQGRLSTYDEASRDNNDHYAKAHQEIKDLARKELPELSESLTLLTARLRKLDLPLTAPSELLIPLKETVENQKAILKERTNDARSKVAHFLAKKEDQEKKRDRIQLLELKRADVQKDLARRQRLQEILGKDELRTYVLSLVEENLIIVTNEELSRLCQGRYEIIHQTKTSKLAPEFFILDKFRDGGIRKVSTLSGGETFMVSLAMALGLAEMTRGTAEIDTLFIDEGFGTLDQDSLEDVVDMLNQIQNRGLMVGIISHVKALTSTLPVNLQLQKRQDGTSSVRLLVN